MKMIGGKQRLCISGWVLAAMGIAAFNVNAWISLESRPLEGKPILIKALSQKIARLESVFDLAQFERFGREAAALPVALRKVPAAEGSLHNQSPGVSSENFPLPVLSGIVRIADPLRRPYFLAVLDGRVYRENEHVQAYLIADISPQGVVLRRDGASWRIANPAPYYSSDGGR